jgi:hypothetical protein
MSDDNQEDQFDAIKKAAKAVVLDADTRENIVAFVDSIVDERNRFIVEKAFNESDREFVGLAVPRADWPKTLHEATIGKAGIELSGPGRMWKQLAAQLLRHFQEYEAFIDDAYDQGLLPR